MQHEATWRRTEWRCESGLRPEALPVSDIGTRHGTTSYLGFTAHEEAGSNRGWDVQASRSKRLRREPSFFVDYRDADENQLPVDSSE